MCQVIWLQFLLLGGAILTSPPLSPPFVFRPPHPPRYRHAPQDFEQYVSGVYQRNETTSGNPLGGHAVRIVGWGTDKGVDYWKIANSWNPHWGENGYFRIIRSSTGQGTQGPGCLIEQSVWANTPSTVWKKQ
jgi:cathepsin B